MLWKASHHPRPCCPWNSPPACMRARSYHPSACRLLLLPLVRSPACTFALWLVCSFARSHPRSLDRMLVRSIPPLTTFCVDGCTCQPTSRRTWPAEAGRRRGSWPDLPRGRRARAGSSTAGPGACRPRSPTLWHLPRPGVPKCLRTRRGVGSAGVRRRGRQQCRRTGIHRRSARSSSAAQ